MSSKISSEDLFNRIALKVSEKKYKASIRLAKVYTEALYDVILEELQKNNEITIPSFGTFKISHLPHGERWIYDLNGQGEKKLVYIEQKDTVKFNPLDSLKESVNTDFKRHKHKRKSYTKPQRPKTFADLINTINDRKENNHGEKCISENN